MKLSLAGTANRFNVHQFLIGLNWPLLRPKVTPIQNFMNIKAAIRFLLKLVILDGMLLGFPLAGVYLAGYPVNRFFFEDC